MPGGIEYGKTTVIAAIGARVLKNFEQGVTTHARIHQAVDRVASRVSERPHCGVVEQGATVNAEPIHHIACVDETATETLMAE